jgi:hypothetical protein
VDVDGAYTDLKRIERTLRRMKLDASAAERRLLDAVMRICQQLRRRVEELIKERTKP